MTKTDLQSLFSRPKRLNRSVLSVYLNVDQSQQANMNRGFETKLNDLTVSLRDTIEDESEMERFLSAALHVRDFVSIYRPRARGLAMFVDTSDGFFWHREFEVPLQSEARWDRTVFYQPLANAADQFDEYAVALLDRTALRLFYVFLGEIEECVRKEFGSGKTRHTKTTGTDFIGSASHLQRKADEHIRANLRRGVMILDAFVHTRQLHRVLLAGTPEITSEFRELLPKHLSGGVIGALNLAANATTHDVLTAAQPIANAYERSVEVQRVDEVVTAAAKTDKAVVGLASTLEAVNCNRAWQFIYSEGLSAPGFECSKCSALFAGENPHCAHCGGAVHPIGNVVERAVEQAVRKGSEVEVVTGKAAGSLDSAGGIGALLKTRTAT